MTVVVILLIRRKYRGGAELGGGRGGGGAARQISKTDLLSPSARGEPQEGDIHCIGDQRRVYVGKLLKIVKD